MEPGLVQQAGPVKSGRESRIQIKDESLLGLRERGQTGRSQDSGRSVLTDADNRFDAAMCERVLVDARLDQFGQIDTATASVSTADLPVMKLKIRVLLTDSVGA